ncbi:MAG: DUF4351 domain-containing protein [Cellulosilyticaceae bacterium]
MTEVGRMILEEGIEQGRAEMRQMLIAQLTTKFKKITIEDLNALKKLPMDKIHAIGNHIFSISSLEELREYFEA